MELQEFVEQSSEVVHELSRAIEDRQVLEMAMLRESRWWLYTAHIPAPGRKEKGQ